METKPLLYGLIGFFLGGLIVSSAATYIDTPVRNHSSDMTMSQMTEALANKRGDEFDKAFLAHMIEHHEGAVEMARLSANNAKHEEIKKLSENIILTQNKEIADMRLWQSQWNYPASGKTHSSH